MVMRALLLLGCMLLFWEAKAALPENETSSASEDLGFTQKIPQESPKQLSLPSVLPCFQHLDGADDLVKCATRATILIKMDYKNHPFVTIDLISILTGACGENVFADLYFDYKLCTYLRAKSFFQNLKQTIDHKIQGHNTNIQARSDFLQKQAFNNNGCVEENFQKFCAYSQDEGGKIEKDMADFLEDMTLNFGLNLYGKKPVRDQEICLGALSNFDAEKAKNWYTFFSYIKDVVSQKATCSHFLFESMEIEPRFGAGNALGILSDIIQKSGLKEKH